MRAWRSIVGAALAALYAAAFVYAYVDYSKHADQWLADIGLMLLAMPFAMTMRFLSGGSFDMAGDDTMKVVAAALFCCALAYLVGAALEFAVRSAFRFALRARASN